MLFSFTVESEKRNQIIDITKKVNEIVKQSKVKEGICVVYVPHATAGILINENWDPNVMLDILDMLEKIIPRGVWRHDKVDGNGDAHIKAALVGPSETIIIREGRLLLGRWQDIMLADFDGPRRRTVYVEIISK
ncbi:YjbQ family protein [Candidatus Micrarchaeota archaeon]|nr:MAG: YjbQ family protein [Candidatus Micrarchaeota archaeon]